MQSLHKLWFASLRRAALSADFGALFTFASQHNKARLISATQWCVQTGSIFFRRRYRQSGDWIWYVYPCFGHFHLWFTPHADTHVRSGLRTWRRRFDFVDTADSYHNDRFRSFAIRFLSIQTVKQCWTELHWLPFGKRQIPLQLSRCTVCTSDLATLHSFESQEWVKWVWECDRGAELTKWFIDCFAL